MSGSRTRVIGAVLNSNSGAAGSLSLKPGGFVVASDDTLPVVLRGVYVHTFKLGRNGSLRLYFMVETDTRKKLFGHVQSSPLPQCKGTALL